ncbi:hypothetical protein [Thalassoroseus pseudoceratinae]|uniref:hypothetical protein n=1 Tax=Thalassoroseus pseudoceratinae TaxID=2713176 RepID=UPI00141E17E8|nr:hypothetical protein [Thalassoroseus pseudoceratinae]
MTWPQHFQNRSYYTAHVSKILHMGVRAKSKRDRMTRTIPASCMEWVDSPEPEWKALCDGETLEGTAAASL